MSLSIAGIGAVQPVYAPVAPTPYAPSDEAAASVAATIAGAETGAVSVVYEPGPADAGEPHVYSSRAATFAALPAPSNDAPASFAGDSAVVQATGGAVQPPPVLAETPHAAEVNKLLNDVWAPVGPTALDPAAANAAATGAPVQAGQAEASAQASYAAMADAMITGAPLSDLEKFA